VLRRGCWTPVTTFARLGHGRAQWQWEALRNDGSSFRLYQDGEPVLETAWGMIGVHNVANACAVAAAASGMGVSAEICRYAFASFSGVRRRMTLVGEARGIRIFDDFAHHPTAIKGMVSAAKAAMVGKGRLRVVLEPRSNTMRSRIHQERLPACFDAADEVLFVPASDRNLAPDAVLNVDAVCAAIGEKARVLPDAGAIIAHLTEHAGQGDDVLILSNGGFEGIHKRLLERLRQDV